MTHHGMIEQRGCQHTSALESSHRFGRMFPDLPPLYTHPCLLEQLGALGGPMDEGANPVLTPGMPAGFVFFGQFIDHDITLDVTSSIDRSNDPEAIGNFRTPVLDLDCIYGAGPEASPHLYVQHDGGDVFANASLLTRNDGVDLARNPAGRALIGDPRNDENPVVSQLQLAFIRFHNEVVRRLAGQGTPHGELFETAQQRVRWHYQWILLWDFLPRIAGRRVVLDILGQGRAFYLPESEPFIPVEFSGAAYRFGHSQVPSPIAFNDTFQNVDLFDSAVGATFNPLQAGPIDWRNFFGPTSTRARPIDTKLSSTLLNLPFVEDADPFRKSLAVRNLLRGQALGLPSGQAICARMEEVLGVSLPEAGIALPQDFLDAARAQGLRPGALLDDTPL